MAIEQQGRPIASLSADERQMFRNLVNDLQALRIASSIRAVPARTVLEPGMADSPPGVKASLMHLIHRDEQGPAFGETAPDFSLKRSGSDDRVTLSSFRGKSPVGLIFGSYT